MPRPTAPKRRRRASGPPWPADRFLFTMAAGAVLAAVWGVVALARWLAGLLAALGV